MTPNRLFYGDCLTIMRQELPDDSVDLIYLDPPFNSNQDYHSIYKDETGRPLPEQIQAFSDMWTLDDDAERAIKEMPDLMLRENAGQFGVEMWGYWVRALRDSQPSMLAYLAYMGERLIRMRRLLKPTGSLYFHCDPTASHYLKVFMDGVFGHDNFLNEILWCYRRMPSRAQKWQSMSDSILFYSKTNDNFFKVLKGEPSESSKRTHASAAERGYNANLSKKMVTVFDWKKYEAAVESGELPQDLNPVEFSGGRPPMRNWWTDIPILAPNSKERLSYKTQKPVALLKRIIKASCPPDGVVLDPFCGCGTTMQAAQELERRWIGIDIAFHAVNRVTRIRLEDRLGLTEGVDFTVGGIPNSVESARALWKRDPYHFQAWAVEMADGFVTAKRGKDGGVDGRLYFEESDGAGLRKMILQVKGGANVGRPDAQRLAGVLDGMKDADLAGLIALDLSPRQRANIENWIKNHGDVVFRGIQYLKVQLLTVAEMLEGKRFNTPPVRGKQPTIQRNLL